MKKRVICMMLTAMMIFSEGAVVSAKTIEQLQQEKSQSQSELEETQNTIDALSIKQSAIQSQINEADADLVDLMIQVEAMEADIVATEDNIQVTQEGIDSTQEEITNTEADLEVAEENKDQQYEDMKKRIQYIYENGGDEVWLGMIFDSDNQSITDFLNRAEYAQSMHDYDRESLEKYIEVVNQVTELKNSLEEQKTSLEEQKASLEEQKVSLESQKSDLDGQKADLQVRLDEMKATSSNYESQLAAAQSQASAISNLIAQQNAEINRLEEEERARQAAEEEARRQAEEQARQEAAAAQRRQEEERAAANNSSNTNNTGSTSNATNNGTSNDSGSTSTSKPDKAETTKPTAPKGSGTGAGIVAYADQFVGNPYVWGGNSLYNGIDCSHFVWQVLKNCGVYSGGYTTSAGWRSLGSPVSSLAEAQAGDVICYSGHVAIYDGAGGIVEAKGSRWGITHDRSATHGTILAIRRFV